MRNVVMCQNLYFLNHLESHESIYNNMYIQKFLCMSGVSTQISYAQLLSILLIMFLLTIF